jgi:Spy/CpxP family protein refolding chaperone
MKKVTLAFVAVLFAAVVATTALAFGPGRGPGYGPCARGDFYGPAGLNLTAGQTAKIKEIRDAQRKEIRPLREKMFTKRDEIRRLWLESSPDETKITAAQKEMRVLRDQMEDKMTAFRLKSANVLTAEQRETIESLGHRRGPGRGSVYRRGSGSMRGLGLTGEFGPGAPCGESCFGSPVNYMDNRQ